MKHAPRRGKLGCCPDEENDANSQVQRVRDANKSRPCAVSSRFTRSVPPQHFTITTPIHSRSITSNMAPVFKLAPGVQSYAWGKKGQSSLAAQFSQVSVPDFTIDENETYAEVSAGCWKKGVGVLGPRSGRCSVVRRTEVERGSGAGTTLRFSRDLSSPTPPPTFLSPRPCQARPYSRSAMTGCIGPHPSAGHTTYLSITPPTPRVPESTR